MGVGSSIVNFFTSSWGSNTGVTSGGGGRVVKSLTSQGRRISGGSNTNGVKASEVLDNLSGSFGVNYKVKEILETYPLTTLFLSIYESILSDIVSKSNLEVKIKDGEDSLVDDLNSYLKELDYKKFITDNLRTSLYWGSYASPIFMSKETGRFKLGEFYHSEKFVPAYYEGNLKSYVYKDLTSEEGMSGMDGDDVLQVPADEVVYLGFNQHRKFPVVLNKESKKGIDKIIVNLSYRFSSGILDDCLYLLYNHLINTYISQLLTLKNALRPDVLMAQAADEDQSITETTDDIENIEACLNNNESGVVLGLFGGDPNAMLTSITSSILNQLKVVPSLSSYRGFEIIDFPQLEEKLAKLEADLQNKKLQIGNSLGIPEELLNSSSNRWEVVSRSATFQHAVNKCLVCISNSIKQTSLNYLKKYHKVELTPEDLDVTFDTNNILFNTEYIQKQQLMNDKLEAISRMSSNLEQIKENPTVNRYELDQWYSSQLGNLDPDLKKIFAPPPLPELIDPLTGQRIPPEQVLTMIQTGQIDQYGNPLTPPPEDIDGGRMSENQM